MKDSYLTYNAVQLAADEEFIRSVHSPDPSTQASWDQWLQQHPEQRATVEEARRLVLAISFTTAQPATDTQQLWERIQRSAQEETPVRQLSGYRRWGRWGAVAAAVVLLLVIALWGIDGDNTIRTGQAQHLTYVLPDETEIRLNADSEVAYRIHRWKGSRHVEMVGEAFFSVTKGEPFVVETPVGTVEVLGTSFNVFSRRDSFHVLCTSGRVQVRTRTDAAGVQLTPGEQARLGPQGRLLKQTVSGLDAEVDWLTDIYRFKDQPMSAVFAEMERQFAIEIQSAEDIRQRLYTGFFVGTDLEEALQSVCWPQKLQYSRRGNKVTITLDETSKKEDE